MCKNCHSEKSKCRRCGQCRCKHVCDPNLIPHGDIEACNVDVSHNLYVCGKASVSEGLCVGGKTELSDTCVDGDVNVSGDISARNVNVSGDLCVDGKIKNTCLDLDKYVPPPPSDDVYDQNELGFSDTPLRGTQIMERIQDASFPLSERLCGVFGYNDDDEVSLTGGRLYNDNLTELNFRVHGRNPSQELDAKFEDVVIALENTSKWFSGRGIPITPADTVRINEDQFNYRNDNLDVLLNMILHYEEGATVPSAVDMYAVGPSGSGGPRRSPYGTLGVNDDVENRDPRFGYSVRVPLTQDCEEYKTKVDAGEPIVFHNKLTNQIVVNVVDQAFLVYQNTFENLEGPINRRYYLVGVQGKFQLMKRDRRNNLVSASPQAAEYIIQVSETVEIQGKSSVNGEITDDAVTINYFNENGRYTGCALALMNGGSPAQDIYLTNPGGENATGPSTDPFLTPSCHCGGNNYAAGDNPNTPLVELSSAPSAYYLWDGPTWDFFDVLLDPEFLENPLLPEQAANFPPVQVPPIVEVMKNVHGHEYMHNVQGGLGQVYQYSDGEGQATGVEFDPKINNGDYFVIRTRDQLRFITRHARGIWPLLASEGEMITLNVGFPTYGDGLWWRWLAKCYDPNYQIMRRANDILATKYGEIMSTYEGNSYGAGFRLAMQQAMQELQGLDLSEVFRDFAISLSLIRNNGSIPSQYHTKYPLWTQQPAYRDANRTTFFDLYLHWWSEFDQNTNPAPSAAQIGGYDTLLPQLVNGDPLNIDLYDLASNIFVVDKENVNSVKVTNNKGRIVVTMHQYTPNVPDINGTFTIQGPYELAEGETQSFNVADFTNDGLVRLVVSNVSVTDFGSDLANVTSDPSIDRITGKATVETN